MFGSKLAREVALHDDECQVMFASRLAKANGYRDLEEFCWMTSLPLSRLQTMDEETTGLLSAWSGVPAGRLQRFALTGHNVTSFGATSVRRSQLEMATLRVCRHCLCHDMLAGHGRAVTRPYVRAVWRWMVIGTCPIHGCELEAISADDIAAWIARRGDALGLSLPEIRKPYPADVYFANRVTDGGKASEFLDELPAYVAAEFCTVIGHFKNLPEDGRARNRIPDGFMNASCRQEGYLVAKEGKDAILSFLSQHVRAAIETTTEFKDIYGVARRWLRKFVEDPDYRPVVELFQHHAEQHIPMEAGDVFLTEAEERQVHTVRSAAVEYQLTPDRVKNVVEKHGFTSVGPDGGVMVARVFTRAALHEHLVLEKQLLTTPEAASLLGCTWQFLDILLQQGHLPYHSNSEDHARVFRRITRKSVESLLARFKAQRDCMSNDALVSIHMATAICHCKVPEIVALIFGGKLKKVSWSGQELLLKNLLVDPQEVLPHVTLDEAESYLDVAALEKALRTTTVTIDELLKRRFLPVEMRRHPRTRVMQRFVHPVAVEAFLARHISLSAMARENGKQIAGLKQTLDKEGIKPIFEPTGKIARFYRRSDVRRLGLA
ncbi:TniQ family protein [Sinorhizobium fredii]|uniref:TniQ family protein n=1 Tax=Rhizobium fredii TaxID=380 RepID=UPI0012FDF01F|nr:TniQ family protein [Sinorhizobium fredii]